MKYLAFDIECADGGKGTICTFGYIIADMNFKIIRRKEIIINPEARFNLIGREGRPDIHLAYPIETFKKAPAFDKFYDEIKTLLESKDYHIIGHSVGDDATYLNKACKRYKLAPINFQYFDTQRMYRELFGEKNLVSIENAVLSLGIDQKFRYHQSVEDARATLILLKAMLEKTSMTFEQFIESTNKCGGETRNGQASWYYYHPSARRPRFYQETNDNTMRLGKKRRLLFSRYVDFGNAIGKASNKLAGKRICISSTYEHYHYKEMLTIVGMIKAAGGEYERKASLSNVFVTFEANEGDGQPIECTRRQYVQKEIESGKAIDIITFEELLNMLEITYQELESAEIIDVEYLLDDKYQIKK